MKDDIDDILRDNIPRIKRDPLFLQETLRRMDLVEGIKEEVDRQHRRDRFVLFAALLLAWR